MNDSTIEKLAAIAQAGKALAHAAHLNGLQPHELTEIVLHYANKQQPAFYEGRYIMTNGVAIPAYYNNSCTHNSQPIPYFTKQAFIMFEQSGGVVDTYLLYWKGDILHPIEIMGASNYDVIQPVLPCCVHGIEPLLYSTSFIGLV